MTSDIMDGHVPDGGAMLAMNPPAQTGGFIDVECLTDIHKYLSQSEKSDDITLAAWIKQQYLQDPLIETGRLIRDSEGFANLDKAYRRVRHLTGKAVDKWPFFDQNWKKMSSSAVRNAILRADTVTKSQPTINGRAHDVPMNGLGGQHNHTSQTSDSRMVSSAKNSDGHRTQEQKSPQQADRTPPNNRATEQIGHCQDRSPGSQSDSVLETGVQIERSDALAFEGNVNSAMSPAKAIRDAGLGKVRGVRGRFVNNNSPSSTTARKGLRVRSIQKPRTKAAMQSESEEEDVSSDEGVKAPITISDVTSPSSDGGGEIVRSGNDTSSNSKINAAFNATNLQSPMSAILAADAEAVSSSLDRLPPGLTHKKRKSESNIQERGPKRTRGSRGGLIGRPRKSGTLAEPVSEHDSEGGKTRSQSEKSGEVLIATPVYDSVATPAHIPVETPVKTPARRSSRKSAASALESSTPWDPTADVLLGGGGYKQPTKFNAGTKSNGATEALHVDSHSTRTSAEFDQKTEGITEEIVGVIPPIVKTDPPLSQSPKLEKTPASTEQKKHVSSLEGQDDDVRFFARITTSAGIRDIPLSGEDLMSDVNLVKRYAAWQRAGNPYATFETFKNIAQFTR